MIAFVLAGISFVFSVFWWFKFHIWGVIEYLTGRTARKEIAKMQAENEKNANFYLGLYSDKKQDKAAEEKVTIKKVQQKEISETAPMEKQSTQRKLDDTAPLEEETVPMEKQSTQRKLEGTVLLEKKENSKSLPQTEFLTSAEKQVIALEMLEDIVLIHTEENI